ncbi:DedA family protein [Ktedonosporobacter rubrisoli]|uniref:DedA family protein n=1 Tax=Ktedonosporobacter rubrisoli TaxID=2509675 RepID=UPI0013EE8B42|nr:DedA family protein [Ktedonosporobacter rubrisoli]
MLYAVTHFLMHVNPLLIYLIVAVVLALESSGIPIANSTLLLFTGALASFGYLDIWQLTVAASLGSIVGACVAYAVGKRGGRRLLLRMTLLLHGKRRMVNIVERWFLRAGTGMVFFSRMIPYIRPFACFPAGIARMKKLTFFLAASAGSLIWCCGMLTVGWYLGQRWMLAVHLLYHYTVPALCAIALLLALYFAGMYMVKRYLRSRFELVPSPAEDCEEAECSRDLLHA